MEFLSRREQKSLKVQQMKERIEKYKAMSTEEVEEMRKKVFEYCIIDKMLEKDYHPKFYNGCYGGSGHSLDVGYLFRLFFVETEDKEQNDLNKLILKARIVRYLGDDANGEFSCPVFDFVKNEMYKFIIRNEYDGLENLEFDEDRYKLDAIKKIITNSSYSSDEKINKINEIYSTRYDEDVIVDYEEAEKWLESH